MSKKAAAKKTVKKSVKKSTAKKAATKNASGAGALASNFVDAGLKNVTFSCSRQSCIVGITAASVELVFVRRGAGQFPVGSYPMFYRVQGSGNFSITVAGATLDTPISNIAAPNAGVRLLTVK